MAQWYALVVGSVRSFVFPTYWAGHLVSFFNLDQRAWKIIVQGQVWPCPFTYISSTANYKGRVKRRAHRSKIFTTWPFSEKVCRPLTYTIKSLSSRKHFMLFICKLHFLTFLFFFLLKTPIIWMLDLLIWFFLSHILSLCFITTIRAISSTLFLKLPIINAVFFFKFLSTFSYTLK